MESAHRRASGAAARRKILTVPKSEWIFMRVVPVRTKTFSIRRLDGDRFGCGETLTGGSGVPGQQPTREFSLAGKISTAVSPPCGVLFPQTKITSFRRPKPLVW